MTMMQLCGARLLGAPARGWHPAHRGALIALLAGEMQGGRAVIVRGVHHRASGNQEVNEGCLPCRTEGFCHREGKSRGSPNPKPGVPLFCPLILWQGTRQEVFFPLRGGRANIKSDSRFRTLWGGPPLPRHWPSGGGSALVHLSGTEGMGRES